MSHSLALLKNLIAEPSITPKTADTFKLIEPQLTSVDFTLEYINASDVTNLWATHGSGAPLLCLAGHLDVVPPGPLTQWMFDPFTPTEHDGFLYGRGTADMKSSIATMITAAQTFVQKSPNHPGTLALLLTSNEEGGSAFGTHHVVNILEQRGTHIDYCLVGEPTCEKQFGDTIKHGRRGSLSGKLIIHGIQGHVAYPHLADNPIHRFAPALAELSTTLWDQGDEFFQPTSWQISNLHSGTGATNVIPDSVEIQFNFRHAPVSTAEQLKARFQAILDRHKLKYTLSWGNSIPFLSKPGQFTDIAIESVKTITGLTPKLSTSGGTSDGRFIFKICDQIIEFGPVNDTIHMVNERICLADIEPLHQVYYEILTRVFTF